MLGHQEGKGHADHALLLAARLAQIKRVRIEASAALSAPGWGFLGVCVPQGNCPGDLPVCKNERECIIFSAPSEAGTDSKLLLVLSDRGGSC